MNKKETKRRSTERNSLLVSIINADGKRNEVGRPNQIIFDPLTK